MVLRPETQVPSREQSSLIVVGSEVRCTRMRNVDGDERDAGLQVGRSDRRRNRFVRLELDHEVNSLPNEVLGISQGYLGLVAIVQDDQLDVFAVGRSLQAREDLAREGRTLALRRISNPVPSARSD